MDPEFYPRLGLSHLPVPPSMPPNNPPPQARELLSPELRLPRCPESQGSGGLHLLQLPWVSMGAHSGGGLSCSIVTFCKTHVSGVPTSRVWGEDPP